MSARRIEVITHLTILMLMAACTAEPNQPPPRAETARVEGHARSSAPDEEEAPVYSYQVVNSWPHDRAHFTQGLVYHDGHLYESTGQYGSSLLCRVDLKSGKVQKKVDVDKSFFAEGMTILGDKVFQLTWQSNRGFIYDLKDFKRLSEFAYEGEGWGLTNDGRSLIMSDGTNRLRFLDPETFRVQRSVEVFDHGQPLMEINELEYIKGEIYANIWHSDRVVLIDPATGKIKGWVDLSGLRPPEDGTNDDNVLNGIAYDQKNDRLLVTGKRWSRVYEIKLVRK